MHALPVESPALATAPKRTIPTLRHRLPKSLKCTDVCRDSIVRVVSADHGAEPTALLRDRLVQTAAQFKSDLSNLRRGAVALSRRAVEIAVHEYEAGLQTVATAQATELANEETELQVASNRLVQSVALLKALGGGRAARTAQTPLRSLGNRQ
jgi:hypothetical protein